MFGAVSLAGRRAALRKRGLVGQLWTRAGPKCARPTQTPPSGVAVESEGTGPGVAMDLCAGGNIKAKPAAPWL